MQGKDLQNAFKILKLYKSSKDLCSYDSDAIRSVKRYIQLKTTIDRYNGRNRKDVFCVGNERDFSYIRYEPKVYWLDEFFEYIKNNGEGPLHRKDSYIRIGNNFYDSNKFFQFQNEIYSKDDYSLVNGQLIDKTRSLDVEVEYTWTDRSENRYKRDMQYKIVIPEGQHFETAKEVEKRRTDRENGIATVMIGSPHYSYFPGDFWISMFRLGDKRFRGEALALTTEEAEQIEFDPLPIHKQVLDKFVEIIKNIHADCLISPYVSTPEQVDTALARTWGHFSVCLNYIYFRKEKTKDMYGKIKAILNEMAGNGGDLPWSFCKKWIKTFADMEKVVKKYA